MEGREGVVEGGRFIVWLYAWIWLRTGGECERDIGVVLTGGVV